MKKILKKIVTIVLCGVIGFMSLPELTSSAETVDNSNAKISNQSNISNYLPIVNSPYSIIEGDKVIYFNTKEDYDIYNSAIQKKTNVNTKGTVTPYYGEGIKTEILSTQNSNYLWIGYHSGTKSWSKASSYTLTNGTSYSVSGSYKYQGYTVSTGFTYTSTIATTIPANSSLFSRLGTWGDFQFRYCKYIETQYGVPTGRVSYGVEKTMYNHYVAPVYQ